MYFGGLELDDVTFRVDRATGRMQLRVRERRVLPPARKVVEIAGPLMVAGMLYLSSASPGGEIWPQAGVFPLDAARITPIVMLEPERTVAFDHVTIGSMADN